MSDDGELLHLSVANGPDRFDTTLTKHHHIKCTSCGKVCDINIPELPMIEQRIKDESGFSVSESLLFFDGICSECSKNKIK